MRRPREGCSKHPARRQTLSDARDGDDIRRRGDAAEVEEPFRICRVGYDLATIEETGRQQNQGIRGRFMRNGIYLTEQFWPRIFQVIDTVRAEFEARRVRRFRGTSG